jgi:YHS domain-containing protein
MYKDPVCGKRINRGKAHEGYRFYLCCPRCQTEFEHNLALYGRPELGQKIKKTDLQQARR